MSNGERTASAMRRIEDQLEIWQGPWNDDRHHGPYYKVPCKDFHEWRADVKALLDFVEAVGDELGVPKAPGDGYSKRVLDALLARSQSGEINQCDDCRRGLPLRANNIHYDGEFPSATPVMGCTKDRYVASTSAPMMECAGCGHHQRARDGVRCKGCGDSYKWGGPVRTASSMRANDDGREGSMINLMMPKDLHQATKALVFNFACALAEKLHAAEKKYGYSDGWMSNNWEEECRAKLHGHMAKGDPRDVANFCAFMWHHGWSTNAAVPPGNGDGAINAGSGNGADRKSDLPPPGAAAPLFSTMVRDLDDHAIRRAAEYLEDEADAICITLGKALPSYPERVTRPLCDRETELMNLAEIARRLRRMLPENVETREGSRAEAVKGVSEFLKLWKIGRENENVVAVTGATCLYAADLDKLVAPFTASATRAINDPDWKGRYKVLRRFLSDDDFIPRAITIANTADEIDKGCDDLLSTADSTTKT